MIVVTKMKLGDYDVPVPVGLSELLKDAWVLKDRPGANTSASEYTRRIEMRNGRLYTILTKKEVTTNAQRSHQTNCAHN
jgi:hypothetical protein